LCWKQYDAPSSEIPLCKNLREICAGKFPGFSEGGLDFMLLIMSDESIWMSENECKKFEKMDKSPSELEATPKPLLLSLVLSSGR